MRAFFLLSLVAAVYGMPASLLGPGMMQPDLLPGKPIIIEQNPLDMTRPLGPNIDHLINSAIIGEITRPIHIDNAIPSIDGPTIVDLPAEITPKVQIIINIIKKTEETVENVPHVPEIDSVVPLVPVFPIQPDFGVFPIQPELTRPNTGIDTDILRPGVPAQPDFGVFPILPELTRPNTGIDTDILRPGVPAQPDFGAFPIQPEFTRPNTGIEVGHLRPGVPVQGLDTPMNSIVDRPATSIIR